MSVFIHCMVIMVTVCVRVSLCVKRFWIDVKLYKTWYEKTYFCSIVKPFRAWHDGLSLCQVAAV